MKPRGDTELQRNVRDQDDERERFGAPLTQGVLVEGIEIATGTQEIPHPLGRIPRGWIITRSYGSSAPALRELPNVANARRRTHLRVTASAAGTIDLWVF